MDPRNEQENKEENTVYVVMFENWSSITLYGKEVDPPVACGPFVDKRNARRHLRKLGYTVSVRRGVRYQKESRNDYTATIVEVSNLESVESCS